MYTFTLAFLLLRPAVLKLHVAAWAVWHTRLALMRQRMVTLMLEATFIDGEARPDIFVLRCPAPRSNRWTRRSSTRSALRAGRMHAQGRQPASVLAVRP